MPTSKVICTEVHPVAMGEWIIEVAAFASSHFVSR